MKKFKLSICFMIWGLVAFLGMVNNAFAAQKYDLSFQVYHAESCGDVSKKTGATNCMNNALAGKMNSYEVTDGHVTAGEMLMVLVNIASNKDAEVLDLSAEIGVSSEKLAIQSRMVINPGSTEDLYGFLPYDEDEEQTNWNTTLTATPEGSIVLISYDQTSGSGALPLTGSGTFGAFFVETSSDLQPGEEVSIQYLVSDNYPSFSVNGRDLTSYVTTTSFPLSVQSEISNVKTFKELTATGSNSVNYPFGFVPNSKNDLEYTFYVPNHVTSITFQGVPTDSKVQLMTGLDTAHTLNVGKKDIELTITAESGDIETYVIHVIRLNNDASLNSVTATNDITFAPLSDTTKNTVTVSYKTTSTMVSATTTDTNAKVVSGTGSWTIATDNNTNYSNPYQIVVNAEDCDSAYATVPDNKCTSKTYEFEIIRTAPSKNVKLSDLKIDGVTIDGFSPEKDEYTLDVAADKGSIEIAATPQDSLNSVTSGVGTKTVNVGNNTYEVIVTSEDGVTTGKYTIHLYRKSNETELLSLNITSNPNGTLMPGFVPTFDANSGEYTYTYEPTVTSIEVTATVKDNNKASVSIIDMSSSEMIDNSDKTLNMLSKTFTTETTKVGVIVTAEDGSTRVYKVVLDRQKSSNAFLSSISITGNDGKDYSIVPSKDNVNYTVTLPSNVSEVTMDATKEDSHSTISESLPETFQVGFDSDVKKEIHVLAEDGVASKTYTITFVREKSHDASLKTIGYKFNESDTPQNIALQNGVTTYTLAKTGYENSSIYFEVETTDENAVVSGDGKQVLKTGDNSFDIVVTAQDGTTKKTYTIKIERAKNNDATLRRLSVTNFFLEEQKDNTMDLQEKFEYHLTVDELKSILLKSEVIAEANDQNATVVWDSGDLTLSTTSSNAYQITVTAEDGITTQVYTIVVTRPKSTDTRLQSVTLVGATLSPTFNLDKRDGYVITVPYGKETFGITGNPNVMTSTVISGNGIYTVSETNEVVLTIESESGDTGTYTFQVLEAASDDSTLSSLFVTDHEFVEGNFDPEQMNYQIGTIEKTEEKLEVHAIPNNADATVSYYLAGVKIDACDNLDRCEVSLPNELGEKTITVEVIAADGDSSHKHEYTIRYEKVASSNNYLSFMEVMDTTSQTPIDFNPEFAKETLNYSVNVSYETDSVTVNLTTENSDAKIAVNGGESTVHTSTYVMNDLKEGTNNIQIIVTAENGNTKEYNITVNRANYIGSDDAFLSSLKVVEVLDEMNEYTLTPNFDAEVEKYDIGEIPYSLEQLKILANVNVSASTVEYFVGDEKQASQVVTLPKKNGEETIRIQVTAEDGTTVKNYEITYTKNADTNAKLTNIVLSNGSLNPMFDADTFVYNVTVTSNIEELDITAMAASLKAILKINGEDYVSGDKKTISLVPGQNSISILITAEDGSTENYFITINRETTMELITSEEYGHTIMDGYIKTVAENTTVIDMKNQLDNENSKLKIYASDGTTELTDADTLGTGMIVKLFVDDEVVDSKIIVIKGDVNGDGVIDVFDASDVLEHYVERTLLEGAYLLAGDIDDNEMLDIFDASDILEHYVERKPIEFMKK